MFWHLLFFPGMEAGHGLAAGSWPVLLADLSPVDAEWLITGLKVAAFAIAIAVGVKHLRTPAPKPAAPMAQPLLVQLEEAFVKRGEFLDLKTDLHNQLKDLRSYVHEGVHVINKSVEKIEVLGHNREERMNAKLDEHWKGLSRERSVSTAKLHERMEATNQRLREELDAKVGDIRHEVSELPQRLIGILKDTGALDRNGGRS